MPSPALIAGLVVGGIATGVALATIRPWERQFHSRAEDQWSQFRDTFQDAFDDGWQQLRYAMRDTVEELEKRSKKAWDETIGRDASRRADEDTIREIEEFELAHRERREMEESYQSEFDHDREPTVPDGLPSKGQHSVEESFAEPSGKSTQLQIGRTEGGQTVTHRGRNIKDHEEQSSHPQALNLPHPSEAQSNATHQSLLDEADEMTAPGPPHEFEPVSAAPCLYSDSDSYNHVDEEAARSATPTEYGDMSVPDVDDSISSHVSFEVVSTQSDEPRSPVHPMSPFSEVALSLSSHGSYSDISDEEWETLSTSRPRSP
ncbi:unnamed protein product [Parajaminaea phylloscopi]